MVPDSKFRSKATKTLRGNYSSTPFSTHKRSLRPASVNKNYITFEQFPFKPKISKMSRSLSSKRKGKSHIFQKLYKEDK